MAFDNKELFEPSPSLSVVIGPGPMTSAEAFERLSTYARENGFTEGTGIRVEGALRALVPNVRMTTGRARAVVEENLVPCDEFSAHQLPSGFVRRAEGSGRGSLLAQYLRGDRTGAWSKLVGLGIDVHRPEQIDDAWAVALETMRRVKENVKRLEKALRERGYIFSANEVVRPATVDELRGLEQLDRILGAMPISLRAFYEVVGSIDLTQSEQQISQPEGAPGRTLFDLGHYSPLVVWPLTTMLRFASRERAAFMPDDAEKSHCSGGHVEIFFRPHADSPLGLFEPWENELFVHYLRTAFEHGGFAGYAAGPPKGVVFPPHEFLTELAAQLEPI